MVNIVNACFSDCIMSVNTLHKQTKVDDGWENVVLELKEWENANEVNLGWEQVVLTFFL